MTAGIGKRSADCRAANTTAVDLPLLDEERRIRQSLVPHTPGCGENDAVIRPRSHRSQSVSCL